jgi:hypothetical protein
MANRAKAHRIASGLGAAGGEPRHRNRKAIEIERRILYHDGSQLKAWAAGVRPMRRIKPPQSGQAAKGS